MPTLRSVRSVVRPLEGAARRTTPSTAATSYRLARQTVSSPSRSAVQAYGYRSFSLGTQLRKEEPPTPSGIGSPKSYNYQEVADIVSDPQPDKIIIDVREPSELLQTGRIPTAKSVPISSAPDAFFLSEEDFETRFGFPRPGENDEVIFYCKAGVRSRQAALLAGQARPTFGGKVGNYNGSWLDWEKSGGKAEKEGEQGEQSPLSAVTNAGQGSPRP